MIIRKLEYLMALAREEHFGHAAEACHVSQPTLSAALRQLEAELGVMILKRGQRYSGLTEEGKRVLTFANRMAIECEHLRRDLDSRQREVMGTVHLGVIASAIPIVSRVTVPFQKRRPHVVVKISDLNPAEIQRAFDEFAIDIAVTYLDDSVRRQGRTHVLYEEEYTLLARKASRFATGTSATWEQISQYPLCLLSPEMLSPSSRIRDLLSDIGKSAAHVETNSVAVLYSQVRTGEWASVIPKSLAEDAIRDGDLEALSLPPTPNPTPVGIMIPDRDLTFPLAEEIFNLAIEATHSKSKGH